MIVEYGDGECVCFLVVLCGGVFGGGSVFEELGFRCGFGWKVMGSIIFFYFGIVYLGDGGVKW